MGEDVADKKVTIKARTVVAILLFVIGISWVVFGVLNSMNLGINEAKAQAAAAGVGLNEVKKDVSIMKCLMQQSNQWQMYGVKPTRTCE